MRDSMVLMAIVGVFYGNAYAGQGFDACLKQEQALRTKEVSQCSGLQYLLNPSGCYATQKSLKEFDEGKCAKIGRKENVVQASSTGSTVSEPAKGGSRARIESPYPGEVKIRPVVAEQSATPVSTSRELGACRKQEQELRTKEADLCSGIKYLLNPSACFSTKKLLKEYDEGKCRTFDPVDSGSSREQSQKNIPFTQPAAAVRNVPAVVTPSQTGTKPDVTSKQERDAEQLREDNARMKAENERLREELEQLRKTIKK